MKNISLPAPSKLDTPSYGVPSDSPHKAQSPWHLLDVAHVLSAITMFEPYQSGIMGTSRYHILNLSVKNQRFLPSKVFTASSATHQVLCCCSGCDCVTGVVGGDFEVAKDPCRRLDPVATYPLRVGDLKIPRAVLKRGVLFGG